MIGNFLYTSINDKYIRIEKYKGQDKIVIVPSKIDDKFVLEVGAAFLNVRTIDSIRFEEGITRLTGATFSHCSAKEIILPNSLSHLEDSAFYCCKNLEAITIPDNVETLGKHLFNGCSSLKECIMPKNIEIIPYCSLANTAIKSIDIPQSVVFIERFAFANCNQLTSIVIPDGVEGISTDAFTHCENLTSVTIPNSVNRIGDYVFSECDKLTFIKCNPGSYAEKWAKNNGFKTKTIISGLQELLDKSDKYNFRSDTDNLITRR